MTEIEIVEHADATSWAWRRLMALADTAKTEELIRAQFQHEVRNHKANIRKQAKQVRYCLIQAREYFDAAKSVGVATRPNLLYYGVTSLAFALILIKGGGRHAFDFQRRKGRKGHHGLELRGFPDGKAIEATSAARKLIARPHLRSGRLEGTFPALLSVLAPEPILCKRVVNSPQFVESALVPYAVGPALGVAAVKTDTYSVANLLACVPELQDAATQAGHTWLLGDCKIRKQYQEGEPYWSTGFAINQCNDAKQEILLEHIRWPNFGGAVRSVDCQQYADAVLIQATHREDAAPPFLPAAGHDRNGRLMLFAGRRCGNPWLPPLAASYAILFLLSMLVRYFPDLWMRAMDARGGFYFLVEDVIQTLEADLPLMVLDQALARKYLRRTFHSHAEPD